MSLKACRWNQSHNIRIFFSKVEDTGRQRYVRIIGTAQMLLATSV